MKKKLYSVCAAYQEEIVIPKATIATEVTFTQAEDKKVVCGGTAGGATGAAGVLTLLSTAL